MPQVIVNKTKWKEEIEGLELFSGLAKHALSQLSYTPTCVAKTPLTANPTPIFALTSCRKEVLRQFTVTVTDSASRMPKPILQEVLRRLLLP
jgi:hypothetical protein